MDNYIHTYMVNRLVNINMRSIYVFSAIVTLLLVANMAKMAYSENNTAISSVIQEGLNECGQLQNDNCIAVMMTLNNICQVEYFPACFGAQWEPTMNELKKIEQHLNKK